MKKNLVFFYFFMFVFFTKYDNIITESLLDEKSSSNLDKHERNLKQ